MQVFESNIEIKRWRNYFENTNIIFKDIVEKLKKNTIFGLDICRWESKILKLAYGGNILKKDTKTNIQLYC